MPDLPIDEPEPQWPHAPALVYFANDGTRVQVDMEGVDLSILTERERAMCVALLELSLKRLKESDDGR